MQHVSSGITPSTRLARPVAIAASLALLPCVAAAQNAYVEPSVSAADRAFRHTPAALAVELTPFALGDYRAGSRLGANAAVGGSVALGVHGSVAGTQVGMYYGSRSLGTLHREYERSFGITAGRPLWMGRSGSRVAWTLGVAGAVGFSPRSESGRPALGGAALSVPFTARLELKEAVSSGEPRSWRSAWSFAPALALYAAPTLGYGVHGAWSRESFVGTLHTRHSTELLPQLQLGARVERLGPLHFQVGWRYSPRIEEQARGGMSAALGFTIR